MISKFSLLGFFLVLSGFSNGQSKNKTDDFITGNEKRIIPYREIKPLNGSRQQSFLDNLATLMEWPNLSNGREGLYIRIWIWDSPKNYVINISDSNGIKNCSVHQINGKTLDSVDYIAINEEWKKLTPRSGWEKFFASLNHFQIFNLPNGDIQKKKTGALTMMAYVQFEVAKPSQYYFYEYLEPSYYRYVDKNSNTVYQFLKYLNGEMQIKLYNPAEKLFIRPEKG